MSTASTEQCQHAQTDARRAMPECWGPIGQPSVSTALQPPPCSVPPHTLPANQMKLVRYPLSYLYGKQHLTKGKHTAVCRLPLYCSTMCTVLGILIRVIQKQQSCHAAQSHLFSQPNGGLLVADSSLPLTVGCEVTFLYT